jgi:NDP-sugar pyrophosphorylase family protein
MQAIILAGGKGTRLKPFTTSFPKPLVPIGDMPILELVLKQLRQHGFTDVILAVNHLAELIMAFFGDGKKLGLNITYSMEDRELGTAGPLSLIERLDDDFLVMNGDVLTTIDYRNLYEYHVRNHGDATISTYRKEIKIDLGVLKIENGRFQNYIEKPTYHFDVSMGIYMFNKGVIGAIPRDQRLDMPELILKLKSLGRNILCYSGDYYWLDIGRVDDYETAVEIFSSRKKEFLPNG